MAKTDWTGIDTVKPEDMNDIGREINEGLSRTRSATVVIAASNSSVKSKEAADYVCTGVDDQNIINTAIASLPAVGGKVILLEGLYTIGGTINLVSNMTLEGLDFASVIKLRDNHNVNTNLITGKSISNTCVKNLQIDGNKTNQTAGIATGISIDGSNNTVTGNTCSNSDNSGIAIDGSNNTVTGNTSSNNYTDIFISGSNNTVTGNKCSNNDNAGIYIGANGTNNTITGNTCNSGITGIIIDGSNNTITGNTCNNSGDTGIYISGGGSRNNIQANTVRRGTATTLYGITILGSNNFVTNNDLYDSATVAFNDEGTGTITTPGNRMT